MNKSFLQCYTCNILLGDIASTYPIVFVITQCVLLHKSINFNVFSYMLFTFSEHCQSMRGKVGKINLHRRLQGNLTKILDKIRLLSFLPTTILIQREL